MTQRVLLVGNPNCGKTTLFNALTASRQQVGNWPGVTVEKKAGFYFDNEKTIEVIDLPGVYSLGLPDNPAAKDAQITAQVLADGDFDLIVNVVNAVHLERHLYLTSQLLELGKPVVLALNMMDLATDAGFEIKPEILSQQLDCPIVTLQAHRQIGLQKLKYFIGSGQVEFPTKLAINSYLTADLLQSFKELQHQIASYFPAYETNPTYFTYRWMEQSLHDQVSDFASPIENLDVVMADARYQMVHAWVSRVLSKTQDVKEQFTAKLDRILLNRYWGLPLFFGLMYGVFFLAIGVGGAVQSGFDILSQGFFMQGPAWMMSQWHTPMWLIQLSAYGLGQACHTLATFIPVLFTMYFLLSFLEASGYMARVAFLMDRVMRSLGLPGQAFVPMIIGFGCNVPAILAARTLQTDRERFLTVLMNPYMSCSARLAIYAVFVAAFFPQQGYQIIFSLYLLGISMAVLTGYLARRTFLIGKPSPLILELPPYHCPTLQRLTREAGLRLRYFILRAGKVILPLCMILSLLTIIPLSSYSGWCSWVGKWLMPIFAPMGLHASNWPAVMSLMTGMLAKEVVIGTLDNLYAQIGHVGSDWQALMPVDIGQICHQAVLATLQHLQTLIGWSGSETNVTMSATLSEQLRQYFISPIAAYAYLIFVLLYIPCVSTMAAIRQEANRRLMWFSIIWSVVLAYGSAVLFYQVAMWVIGILTNRIIYSLAEGLGLITLIWMGWRLVKLGGTHAPGSS